MSRPRAKNKAVKRDNARPQVVAPVGARTIRGRMLFVGVALALGLAVATGRAVMLQTVDGPSLRAEAARNYVRSETLDDWRGDLVDRNGGLLAVTVHRWAVTVDPVLIEQPAETSASLAPILGMTPAAIHERIDPATARPVGEEATHNPATRLARRAATPMVRLMQRAWQTPRDRLDRRLDILEKFFQLEQLQTRAVLPIVNAIAEAAEVTAAAMRADARSLRFFPTRGRRFAYVAHDLDDTVIRAVEDGRQAHERRCRALREEGERCINPLAHVYIRPEPRRYYPKRELAAPLLGLVGRDSTGLSGLELGMDGVLRGGEHSVRVVRDKRGQRIFLEGIPEDAPLGGPTVVLTIDQQMQAIAERELARACLSSGARAGYAIVTRVKTGEVLAVANFPSFNPNTFQSWFRDRQPLADERQALAQRRRDLAMAQRWALNRVAYPGQDARVLAETIGELELEIDAYIEHAHRYPNASRNMAFLDVYEPGSIMKVFTAAAALEEGVVGLTDVFDLENGEWHLHDADDNIIRDVSRMREGDLGVIMKRSSNIGAAKLSFMLGADTLDRYLRDFGFGAPTRSGVPGEARGLLRPAAQWVPVELANVSFGQGMAATGIQLAAAVAALGNEGRLMRPLVVRQIVDHRGRVLRDFEPEVVRQVVSGRTARTVLDLMQGVVEPDGTGRRAYIPEFPVAGKTGTGQKPHLRKRGYSEEMWVNTFFGLVPANDPELAIVVLIDEPSGKVHGGGLIAAPTFKAIAQASLAHLGVPSPFATGTRQAWLDPEVLSRRRDQPPEPRDTLAHLAPPVDVAAGGTVPVPDLRGLTMDEAQRLATGAGLDVQLFGSGIAVSQDIPAHERVPVGTNLRVTFASRAPGLVPSGALDAPAMPPLPNLGPAPKPPQSSRAEVAP